MKIRLVTAQLFHADKRTNGQTHTHTHTHTTKITDASRNYANAPKMTASTFLSGAATETQ